MIFFFFFSENNITNVIESTFSVENNSFGILKVHEKKHNGQQISVTVDNKKKYVKLYMNYSSSCRYKKVSCVK